MKEQMMPEKPQGEMKSSNSSSDKNQSHPQSGAVVNIQSSKLHTLWAILSCIALPLIIYYPSLHAPFIFDDTLSIVDNPDIKHLENLKTRLVYRSNITLEKNQPTRPLTFLTFTLNYHFGKLNPFGYHLVNVVLHIFITILIFFITKKVFLYVSEFKRWNEEMNSAVFPLGVALLFSVHPMNVDVVTHIIHRSDALSTFFYLSALFFFIKTFESSKWFYPFSLFCFILSFASKQIAATLPAMVLIFDYFFISNCKAKNVIEKKYYHFPFWLFLVAIVLSQYFYFENLGFSSKTWPQSTYFITQPYAVLNYLKLLFLPVGQSIDHNLDPVKSIFELRLFLPLFILMGTLLIAIHIHRKGVFLSRIILFSVLWFFITLTPTSSFFPTGEPMAEKRVYLSGWGFSMCLISLYLLIFRQYLIRPEKLSEGVSLQESLEGRKGESKGYKILFYFLGTQILLMSLATWKRNQKYQSPILLWEESISRYPINIRAYSNLADIYYEQKNHAKAEQLFQKAIELNPTWPKPYTNLGNVYIEKKDYNKALQFCQKAIELDPHSEKAYVTVGNIYFEQKDYNNSMKFYKKAIELNPNISKAYLNLGVAYRMQGNYDSAMQFFQRAIDLDPELTEAYNGLGFLYYRLKQYDKAEQFYKKVLELEPDDVEVHCNLGEVYWKKGDHKKAFDEFEIALTLAPNDTRIMRAISFLRNLTVSENERKR